MFRTVIRYGDGTGDVSADFVDYGNAVVWGIGVAEEETGSPVWFGDDAMGLEASALTPDGMRDRLNAEGADSLFARLVDECTTNALMDTPLIGWVVLGTHVPEPERDGTSGSGIRPKDGVVYYNLVIVEGEPVGGFYVDKDDAIEGALGIVESLGGASDQFRDGEDGHLDHEAIADWILNDDRVAYCDLACAMGTYE